MDPVLTLRQPIDAYNAANADPKRHAFFPDLLKSVLEWMGHPWSPTTLAAHTADSTYKAAAKTAREKWAVDQQKWKDATSLRGNTAETALAVQAAGAKQHKTAMNAKRELTMQESRVGQEQQKRKPTATVGASGGGGHKSMPEATAP